MTREEAIEIFEQKGWWIAQKETLTSKQAEEIIKLNNAVNFALSALRPVSREQVEKIYPGCSKCLARGDRNVLNDPGAHDFRLKDSALVYWDEQYGWEGTKVLFCPWCGSPLTDEAVEITMRRLEALNEED